MIDQNKVKSGFDMEVLLGKGFFGEILLAYRDANIFPESIELFEGVELKLQGLGLIFQSNLKIGMCFKSILKINNSQYPSGETKIFFNFSFILVKNSSGNVDNVKIRVAFDNINNPTLDAFLAGIGSQSVDVNGNTYTLSQLKGKITNKLREELQYEYNTNLVSNRVQDMQVRTLRNPAAIGIYINFIMRKGPQPGNIYSSRGNINHAKNLLEESTNIGIFVPGSVYPMLTTEIKTTMARETSPGKYSYPIFDRRFSFARVLGRLKSFTLTSAEQIASLPGFGVQDPEQLLVSINTRVHVRSIDADANAWMTFHPGIKDGKLTWENTRLSTDIDVDWEDQLKIALLGGLFFSIFTGFSSLPFVTAILYGVQSVAENIAEDYIEDYAGGMISSEMDNLMGSIPEAVTIAQKRLDPFYETHYQVAGKFEEVKTNAAGMAFLADTRHQEIYLMRGDVTLKKAVRNSNNKLTGIIYKVPHSDRIINPENFNCPDPNKPDEFYLSLSEIEWRLKDKKLRKRIFLKAKHIKKSGHKIKYIKFDSGIFLTPHEAGRLHQIGAIRVNRFRRIYMRKLKRYYYRGKPDRTTKNNLALLPLFQVA